MIIEEIILQVAWTMVVADGRLHFVTGGLDYTFSPPYTCNVIDLKPNSMEV